MIKFKNVSVVILSFFIVLFSFNSYSKDNGKDKKQQTTTYKPTVDPATSIVNINNISSIVVENGQHPAVLGGNSFNGEIPIGSQLGAIYQEGILWGGIVSDGRSPTVRVGGCTYDVGNVATTRLVRVRPDYQTADLTQDAAGFFQIAATDVSPSQIDEVRAQYEKDWMEWPADLGAPYDDVDGNGSYDPNVDIPGIPGASQTLFIGYDDEEATSLYASPVIGMQVYEIYWAYATSNPLGNVIFKKVKINYKGTETTPSNARIDSMYIAQWADPDVGNYTDDFAGCIPDLDLGYAYSSASFDQKYSTQGLVPPAAGYDFLQGASYFTGDPGDSAIVDLKWRHGYKYFQDKPMSSYTYFAAGGAWSDPTLVSNSGNYDNGTLQMYNLLRGYLPSPNYPSAPLFPRPDEFGGPIGGFGTYLLDGDPTTGQGWVDGIVETPGDRRILCINGPISMELNDTVEVVVALIGAQGVNNISSVSILKYYDTFAQFAYNVLFNVPIMPQPSVKGTALNQQVVLNWGYDQVSIDAIENQPHGDYTFEAYTVYQLPSNTTNLSQGVPVATYDVVDGVTVLREIVLDEAAGETYEKPIRPLNNINGIKRYITIDKDYINNRNLINGQSYRFAITAIAYNESLEPSHILESTPVVVDLTPHSPNPGTDYSNTSGDTLVTDHTSTGKLSDGEVNPIVVDPTAAASISNHNFEVTFQNSPDGIIWNLKDLTAGSDVLTDQANQSGDDTYSITNGIMVKVQGPPLQGKDYSYESADPPNLSPVATAADPEYEGGRWFTGGSHGGEIFFGGVFLEPNFWGETSIQPGEHKTVRLDFRPMASFTDLNGNGTYDIGEPYVVDDPSMTQKAFMYQTFSGDAYEGFFDLPFTAWDISDPDNPRQLNVVVRDRDQNHQWDLHNLADPPDPLLPNEGDQQYNYTWILNTDYDPTGTEYGDGTGGSVDFFSYDGGNGVWDAMWAIWIDDRGNGGMLAEQCSFTLTPNFVNTDADKFTFTAPTITVGDNALAENDVSKINVFPNPYYGYNYRETSREGHYVTFSHLPAKATIRIFDLAGVLVRTIEKNDASTQFQTWDLRNNNNYPVASGIYIVYIDLPELGMTKILKVAMIQEVQVLPVY